MTDRQTTPGEGQLEHDLRAVARALEYPPTPDIATQVGARVRGAPAPLHQRRVRFSRSRWVAVAATIVLVLAAATALIPPAREGIAERLGLRGVEIRLVPTALPTPPDPAEALLLGTPTDLATGTAGVEFRPFQPPRALGMPDAVYLRRPPDGGQLSYVYFPREGLPEAAGSGVGVLISQFLGETNESLIGKFVEPGTVLEVVDVNGARGFWLSGKPHIFFYQDASGAFHEETLRLAANVLVWEVDGITVRIESSLSKEETLAMAQSLTR